MKIEKKTKFNLGDIVRFIDSETNDNYELSRDYFVISSIEINVGHYNDDNELVADVYYDIKGLSVAEDDLVKVGKDKNYRDY